MFKIWNLSTAMIRFSSTNSGSLLISYTMLALPWRLGTAAIVHARSCTLNGCVHTCLDANARASGPSTRVSHSNKALRDIVQFVDFSRLGGDPNRLSMEALSEVLSVTLILSPRPEPPRRLPHLTF